MTYRIELECFYRLLTQTHSLGCDEEGTFHYSPYRIFVLETRLYPLIFKLYPDKNLELTYTSMYNEKRNKMVLHLEIRELTDTRDPFIENKKFYISDDNLEIIKEKIGEITSVNEEYALIDLSRLYESSSKKFSKSYLESMLPYTGLDSGYNPFIRPEGIYLSFNPNADYNTAYKEVVGYILDRVEEYYERGVVVLNDVVDNKQKQNLILNWELERVDVSVKVGELYEPTWEDYRFARHITDFMLERVSGDPYIRFVLPDNLVKRHYIIQELQKASVELIVESSILKIPSDNVVKSQKIAAIIDYGSSKANGRVLVLGANRLSYIYLFFEYAQKKYGDRSIVSYVTNNPETPYIFSLSLPQDEYTNDDDLKEEFRNYSLQRLIEVSQITKLRKMSPHQIIEQEYNN